MSTCEHLYLLAFAGHGVTCPVLGCSVVGWVFGRLLERSRGTARRNKTKTKTKTLKNENTRAAWLMRAHEEWSGAAAAGDILARGESSTADRIGRIPRGRGTRHAALHSAPQPCSVYPAKGSGRRQEMQIQKQKHRNKERKKRGTISPPELNFLARPCAVGRRECFSLSTKTTMATREPSRREPPSPRNPPGRRLAPLVFRGHAKQKQEPRPLGSSGSVRPPLSAPLSSGDLTPRKAHGAPTHAGTAMAMGMDIGHKDKTRTSAWTVGLLASRPGPSLGLPRAGPGVLAASTAAGRVRRRGSTSFAFSGRCGTQSATCTTERATRERATRNSQHATRNTQHTTHNAQRATRRAGGNVGSLHRGRTHATRRRAARPPARKRHVPAHTPDGGLIVRAGTRHGRARSWRDAARCPPRGPAAGVAGVGRITYAGWDSWGSHSQRPAPRDSARIPLPAARATVARAAPRRAPLFQPSCDAGRAQAGSWPAAVLGQRPPTRMQTHSDACNRIQTHVAACSRM